METWKLGDGNKETLETWKQGEMETWRHDMDMETWILRHGDIKWKEKKIEAQAIFLNLFTVCSSCKRKFVVCLFVMKKHTEVICLQIDLIVLPIYDAHSN